MMIRILSFFVLLMVARTGAAQHCPYDNSSICILSMPDIQIKKKTNYYIFLVDSTGIPVEGFAGLRFEPISQLKKKDEHYSLLQRLSSIEPWDFALVIHAGQIRQLLHENEKLYVQIRSDKDELVIPRFKLALVKNNFYSACSAQRFWSDPGLIKEMKVTLMSK